ncbi:FGGY-family carbohydrate kinase [Dinoroseobacter sp. PD6]|uniref:FGGY-family carbohydrate kinase n=1 Tax=Dinoroseobacter sp. PD6 TaxID=3028384 RepID=UPI00237B8446|nr:FGGY-family carbohydrate kinase [Dinoroseobacter sp. PD6]MDD9717505.1 FGGY-family carbohydrate kinase [Dinoroseobacter sp. PD6]
MTCFIGVDVGTGSARAGVFDLEGTLLASRKHDIQMWRAPGNIAEQSSDDIWQAVCSCVRGAISDAGISPQEVRGIGFDAACSLVVLDGDMHPLSVSASGDVARNVIVWMDQRATDQAARINAKEHPVLEFVGGAISPEMQTPKLLWLRENMPESFAAAGQFFDLVDYLTWAATGSLARSCCTVTCKWTYLAHEDRWDNSYFEEIGLRELASENFSRIGTEIVPPGSALAQGLSHGAAAQMGLLAGIPVAAGLIDAHAGGIGTVGADPERGPEATMAYVFGTSACTMSTSPEAHRVPGVWGPYYSAMVPGMWLSEGGQSAAGEAIAHLVTVHPASAEAEAAARAEGLSLQTYLLRQVDRRVSEKSEVALLAGARVVVPDFLGNRAPFADPGATGAISGLTLSADFEDLLATYVAAVLGVGYGLRQIMQAQGQHGVRPSTIVVSGGAGESDTIKQLLADSSGFPVLSTRSAEPVLLGAAMLGAVAAGAYPTIQSAMSAMSSVKARFDPSSAEILALHQKRFEAFEMLQKADQTVRQAMVALPKGSV